MSAKKAAKNLGRAMASLYIFDAVETMLVDSTRPSPCHQRDIDTIVRICRRAKQRCVAQYDAAEATILRNAAPPTLKGPTHD